MGTSIRPDWRFERGAPLVRAQQAAEGETPERAKQVLDLAHETSFTTAFVRDNFDTLAERVAQQPFDAERFARESPLVADWLAKDPSRVALMGRDLTGMGFIERQVTNIATRFRVGREQTELFRIGEAVLDGTATPAMRERQRALETRIRSAPEFDMGFFEGAPGAAAQQLPILARTLKAGGVGAAAGAVVGGALGAAVTKSPAGARTGAKFGLTFGGKTAVAYDVAVMEASGAMLDYERIEGMDTETARGAALIAGALAGSLELLSLQQLAKVTPGLRNLSRAGVKNLLTNPSTRTLLMQTARNIGVAAGTEGVTETLQSLITQGGGTIAEAALDGRLQSDLGGVLGEVFGEEARAQALAEGVVGAQAGLVLSTVGGAASFGLDVRAAHRAERQAESIAALADAGAEATVTGEAPREVESLVTELHQSGLKGFSYDVESWQTFWQSVKDEAGTTLDPRDAAVEVMGDALAYDTAVATNGTFEVPLGPWLTRLAKNPAVREWAVSNARVGPGEMSAAEAIKAQESQDAILSELVETMVTAKAESSPVNDIAETLRTRVEREVRNAGRPVREAKRAGELWASVYRTWAEHSGTTADDLLAMFNRVRIGPQAIQQERADIRATLSADPEFDPALTATPEELTARTNAMDREAELAGMAQEAQPGRASARTKTGRLLTSFAGVSTDALVAEWGAMVEKQAIDEGEVAGLETMPEFAEAQEMVGMAEDRRGVVISGESVSDRAQALATTRGRIAARGQGIQRLAAELAARGIDPTTHQRAIDEATSFDFGQSDIELMARIAEASATIPEDAAERRARLDMDRRVDALDRQMKEAEAVDRLKAEIAAEVDAEERARLEAQLTVVLEQSAFHGTPHTFDRFSLSAIGTGEGAQAFGWGLYFAENEGVAEGYRKALTRADGAPIHDDFVLDGTAYGVIGGRYWRGTREIAKAEYEAAFKESLAAHEAATKRGAVYRVDIADEAVARFLDWDNPISDAQNKAINVATERDFGSGIVSLDATGEQTYREMVRTLAREGNAPSATDPKKAERAASEYLLALGIPGIKYLDEGSRGRTRWVVRAPEGGENEFADEASARAFLKRNPESTLVPPVQTRNLVVFDEDIITITHRNGEPVTPTERADFLEQSAPGANPRGRIRFSADRTQAHIDLFTKANESTFLHESGHLFLTLLGQLAQGPNATDRIRRDYAGALEWLGAKPGDTLSVAQEEQWARGFEAYLMEGKAPSLTLRNAFATFANWLTRLYREVRNLDVELNPEIRGIFDRMLATDAAIREAQDTQLHEPLFAGAEVMPSAEAARYAEALTAAQERATEQVRTETLAVIAREEKAWFTARRKEIEPEVRAEVLATPAYRARVILQTGKMPDGSDLPTDSPLAARLSKEGVVALIGDIGAKALPKPVMYRVEGGLHPDVVAPLFGFENGLALLTALQGTQSVEREVRQRIEYRLRSEYGDPLTDGSLPAKAMAAIHTAERDRVIQLELEEMQRREPAALRGLLRRFGGRVPLTAAVQGQADAMLSARTIRDIRPIEFQRAEVKAAKQAIAAAAKGDWSAAAEAKIRERLALALYRAATQAREEVATQQDRFARFFRSDELLGKTRDLNLVNAARAVLSRVGIGRAEKSAEDYMKAVRAYDPDTAEQLESLIETAVPARDDMRDLTLAEFREITEQATALWEQSRRTRQMVIDGQKVDRQAVVDELAAELATMPDRMKGAGQTKALGTGDIIRRRLIGFEAAIRRIESWVDQMDGGNISGPFRKYLWTPLSEAAALFRIAKRDLTLQYLALLEPMKPRLASSGPIAAPEIGYTFRDRQELLGAMLHTGNESNFDKLTRGRGWSPEAWSLMVRRLERDGVLAKQDYDFLQAVWRLFEAMKPEAQRVHKDMFGYYFDEITARPFETAFGTYEGGYVPALADTMLAEDAKLRAERAEQEGVNPSTMFPTVSRGFTKGRVDEYARPLVMDLRLIRSHIDAVTRFVHLAQPTRDTGRLATDRRFRAALAAVDPEMGAELTAWAQRAGSQVIETPSRSGGGKAADSIFRWFRSTSGLNLMALNVVNTLQQFTGLTIGAVKVPPKYLRDALWQYVRSPKEITAAINALSPYMEGRVNAAVMEVEQRIDRLVANPDALDNAKAFAKEHGYILQSTTQGVVDSVVWRGAFDHATATGADQKAAIRAADAAVRLTQGSFAPEDVSRFETGSPFTRAFTMFYSYFNMQANLMRSEFAQEMRKSGLRQGAGRLLYVYVLGFMAPAVLSQMIVEGMAGTLGADDDDDGYLDEWMAVFFGAQVRTAFALVPGGNIALTVGFNQFNDKWYDDRVSASPAISTLESAGRGAGAPYFWWRDGEVKRRQIRDVLTLLALVTGLPFVAVARPAQYLFDVQQGDAEPTGPVDFTRGLVSGRP